MYVDITGIILAGGHSKRMGVDKSLLLINSKTVIEHIANVMNSVFSNNIIITNTPEKYIFMNLRIYKDIYIGKGPLAGIHSGLTHSKTERNFIISCDIPMINADLIKSIVVYPTQKPIVAPFADGYIQELCAIYSKSILKNIEEILLNATLEDELSKDQKYKYCKIRKLIESVPSEIIYSTNKLKGYFEGVLYNMNSPEDYIFIKEKLDNQC